MLKNILYACALSSIISLTAFANEDARDIIIPTDKVVTIENEVTPENKLASEEIKEDASNALAIADEETPVVITEEKPLEEVLVCDEENTQETKLVSDEIINDKNNLITNKVNEDKSDLLANEENADKSNLVATNVEEETPVVIVEEVAPEALACGCKTKDQNNENPSLACLEEVAPITDEQSLVACEKCGRNCNGKHLLANAEVQIEEENAVLKTVEEVKTV